MSLVTAIFADQKRPSSAHLARPKFPLILAHNLKETVTPTSKKESKSHCLELYPYIYGTSGEEPHLSSHAPLLNQNIYNIHFPT